MAFKETKRKGFNFFRSYYDVYNELESDKDKLAFINALLDRQFLGIKPTNLKGMAKFAWISQVNSIDSQVKGYEDKTKTTLNQTDTAPTEPPTEPPSQGGSNTPTEQVEEKGEEKDILIEFDLFWNIYSKKRGRSNCLKKWKKLTAKEKALIFEKLPNYVNSTPDIKYRKDPSTWLNGKHWEDEIDETPDTSKFVGSGKFTQEQIDNYGKY